MDEGPASDRIERIRWEGDPVDPIQKRSPHLRVTILGSGTSHGVPAVGCGCRVCCSPDPRDHRTRCGITVEADGTTLLIDAPPELRLQVVRSHIRRVDAVLFTHSHADHIFGLDDVRRYNDVLGGDLPIFARADVLQDLERAYRYVFIETQAGGGKPKLALVPIEGDCFEAAGIPIEAIPIFHGELPITSFRIGRFAYVTDVSQIPERSMARLRGLDLLILGALRPAPPHPTHFTIGQALDVVEQLAPRRAYFTHLTHDVSHRETEATLPASVRLAYDGLVLEVKDLWAAGSGSE
jgi:phosphoribosyl 1,2-cyclic phosphate phosphodiesterase